MSTDRTIFIKGDASQFQSEIGKVGDSSSKAYALATDAADEYLRKMAQLSDEQLKQLNRERELHGLLKLQNDERMRSMKIGGGQRGAFAGTQLGGVSYAGQMINRASGVINQGVAGLAYSNNVVGSVARLASDVMQSMISWIPFVGEGLGEVPDAMAKFFETYGGAGQQAFAATTEAERVSGVQFRRDRRLGTFRTLDEARAGGMDTSNVFRYRTVQNEDGSVTVYDPRQPTARSFAQYGMDINQTAQYGGQLAARASTSRPAGMNFMSYMAEMLRVERGAGMSQGELMAFADLNVRGMETVLPQVLQKAVGMTGDAGDIPSIAREIRILGGFLREESKVRATFTGASSTIMQNAFKQVGGAFADARQQELVMGMHRDLQAPPNEYWNAMQMQSILSQDPSLGFSPAGLAIARGRMAQGMFGENMMYGNLQQISGQTQDPMMRMVLLTNRFKSLQPFMGDEEGRNMLQQFFDPAIMESFKGLGGSEAEAKFKQLTMQAGRDILPEGKADPMTEEMTAMRTSMQETGMAITTQMLPFIQTLVEVGQDISRVLADISTYFGVDVDN